MKSLFLWPFNLLAVVLQSCRLALGQIWVNKTRSALTAVGIIIGIASVTSVIAALSGLKAKVLSDFESFGTNKIFISDQRPKTGPMHHASWEVLHLKKSQFNNILQFCPSVKQVTLLSWYGMIDARCKDQKVENVRVTGIQPSWHEIENRSILLGRPFTAVDQQQAWQVCLITPSVRDKLKLEKDCLDQVITLDNRSFRIVGVVEARVESGMIGGGGSSDEIFIPFDTAYKLNRSGIWAIAASINPDLSEDARAEIRFFLRRARHIPPDQPDTFRIETVEKYLTDFKKLAMVFTAVAGGIVSISLLVGGVGIMNIMLVSVSERTREIGLRKAVGARPAAILLQFLIEAVMLCMLGGAIGILVGQLLTSIITHIPNAKLDMAYIPFWAVILSCGFCAFVGVCFGMFPAIKAARLDPIEALRHE